MMGLRLWPLTDLPRAVQLGLVVTWRQPYPIPFASSRCARAGGTTTSAWAPPAWFAGQVTI